MRYLITAVTLLFATLIHAQTPSSYGMEEDDLPLGLEVGDSLVNMELEDQFGEAISLVNDGPTVVLFYRGSWCPYCTRQLARLTDSIDELTSKGATIIAITPQAEEEEVEMVNELVGGQLHIVVDHTGELMKYFDVDFEVTEAYQDKIVNVLETDLSETNDQEVVVLPVPATYIIDSNGVISWRYFDINYRVRATPTEIYDNL